jgi:hypothetical protein
MVRSKKTNKRRKVQRGGDVKISQEAINTLQEMVDEIQRINPRTNEYSHHVHDILRLLYFMSCIENKRMEGELTLNTPQSVYDLKYECETVNEAEESLKNTEDSGGFWKKNLQSIRETAIRAFKLKFTGEEDGSGVVAMNAYMDILNSLQIGGKRKSKTKRRKSRKVKRSRKSRRK